MPWRYWSPGHLLTQSDLKNISLHQIGFVLVVLKPACVIMTPKVKVIGSGNGHHYTPNRVVAWYIGFTPSVRLSDHPTCRVRSVARCLYHGLYPYVAQIQPMRG